MESLDKPSNLDISRLIHQMQVKFAEKSPKNVSRLFPYIETYGKKSDCEDNLLMNKTIKFRESYIHNRTLRYMEPNFSYNQVLSKLKTEILRSVKPKIKQNIKAFIHENKKLKDIISRTELIIDKESHPVCKSPKHFKAKSQFPNGITKTKKVKSPVIKYQRVSPDILRVTNMSFGNPSSDTPNKRLQALTFY